MSLQSLFSYVQRARNVSRGEFLSEHTDPVLVVSPFEQAGEDARFETISLKPGATAGSSTTVGIVRKRPGSNAFAQMITVGRAQNNDIIVPYHGVSKFHAYLVLGFDGDTSITDAGSTNGTFLRNDRLEARTKAPLAPGDMVRFDTVQATFHTAETFFGFLQEVLADPDKVPM